MTKIGELKEKGYFIDVDWIRILGRALPSLVFIALRYPRLIKNANRACPDGPQNLKPEKLPYKIPKYKDGMKFCRSKKRYLRQTHLCNPLDKEIIALGNSLGAFQKSDWEYGETIFKFVNESIRVDFSPIKSALKTLYAGHGTCVDKMSLFIALCRMGGIPARYKLYSPEIVEEGYNLYMAADPLIKKWYDALGFFVIHGSAEVKIKGEWVVCDVSGDPYHFPALNLPFMRFGEDPSDKYLRAAEGTGVIRPEGLPFGIKFIAGLPFKFFGGTGRAINSSVKANYEKGKKIFEKISIDEYDRNIRKTYKPKWASSGKRASKVLAELDD